MNQQANETVDYLASEDTDDQDLLQFADLSLTDEQLDEIKGGPWCTQCGVGYGNHNETTVEDEEAETESIEDLPVADDEQVKGGPWGSDGMGGSTRLNHNETTVEDEEAETESIEDLPVDDDAQVSGGGGITKLGSRRLILQGDGTYQ